MISPDDWESLCLLIEEGWPGEFDETAAKAWRLFLDDYTADQVMVALKTLVARGGTFRPSVAEVVAAIRKDPSLPTFEEAMKLIYGRGGVLRARPRESTFRDSAEMARAYHEARLERARDLHPLVSTFVDRFGIDRLDSIEINHPDYGDVKRKDLRDAWDRHVEAMDGRDVAALASGRRRGELGRLDPLEALGIKKPAQIGSGE
jgi:hypothetical protein